jgi:hypothetical protein
MSQARAATWATRCHAAIRSVTVCGAASGDPRDEARATSGQARRHDAVMAMHEDQLEVDEATVRRLVNEQFPQWKDRPVRRVRTAATVNAIFRIGDDLAARFPLRAQDPMQALAWLRAEAAAARELAAVSPVPTPEPVAIGVPGEGYPLPWTVQTWLPGHDATVDDPAGRSASPRTSPRSSPAFVPSTHEGDDSMVRAAADTYQTTTTGWRPVSGRVSACSMWRGCVRCGPRCGLCPKSMQMSCATVT